MIGDENVHLGGFSGDELSFLGFCAQVHLTAVGFIDGDGGDPALDLALHTLAVDKLDGCDDVVKHNAALLAAVHDDGVDLALDCDGAVDALVDVDGLLDVALNHKTTGALLVLLQDTVR